MTIGTHMATLNLFRESDGSLEITVSGASQELMAEWREDKEDCLPVEYVERLIVLAAERIKSRLDPT